MKWMGSFFPRSPTSTGICTSCRAARRRRTSSALTESSSRYRRIAEFFFDLGPSFRAERFVVFLGIVPVVRMIHPAQLQDPLLHCMVALNFARIGFAIGDCLSNRFNRKV